MRIIDTTQPLPESVSETLWCYNGLDCCLTMEIFNEIQTHLDPQTRATYEFSKALQGPILEMNMRGVLIDQDARAEALASLRADSARVEEHLDSLIRDGIGTSTSWRSPIQLQKLLYGVMGLPVIKKRKPDGSYGPTTDRGALERLKAHFYAEPLINHVLTLRDLSTKIKVLETGIDPDGRIRTSYNIAGTNTGRLSSSLSDFGSGRNLQNIEERLRRIFIADPGMKFANIDLEQADSRNIGAYVWKVFRDSKYLDLCESADLHTEVTRMAWPYELEWTNDPRRNRELADRTTLYRQDSYRQGAKKLGHGTNYYGKPSGMSLITKIPQSIIKQFQSNYFNAFPGITHFHEWVRIELSTKGTLENLLGRRRRFFGRRNDESTLREAIAFTGQSSTADFINTAMLKIWRLGLGDLMLQVHDSFLIQYPEEREDEILPRLLEAMKHKIVIHGREFSIPSEAKVGWNWSNFADEEDIKRWDGKGLPLVVNHDGLKKYRGSDPRRRERRPSTSILDRRIF